MTVHIYDGNNVRLRAMTKPQLGGAKRLSLRQTYEATEASSDMHIWCWDGRGHNQRRKDVFPGYKVGREPMSEDHFSQIRLFRELLTHSKAIQFDCEGWEADDVVATMARYYAAKGRKVVALSNDLDYAQLEANPNITIDGIQKRPCLPRWLPLYKALQGDSSDRIPGIPGFGPKAWDDIQPHLQQVEDGIRNLDPRAFDGVPLTPRVRTFLLTTDNLQLLRNYLLITHLFEVPAEDLRKGMIIGVPDRTKAVALLERYFL